MFWIPMAPGRKCIRHYRTVVCRIGELSCIAMRPLFQREGDSIHKGASASESLLLPASTRTLVLTRKCELTANELPPNPSWRTPPMRKEEKATPNQGLATFGYSKAGYQTLRRARATFTYANRGSNPRSYRRPAPDKSCPAALQFHIPYTFDIDIISITV